MSNNNSLDESLDEWNDMPAFTLIGVQQINRFICGTLGIPLNLAVVAVVLRSKQLWSPRNIFWLVVTFFIIIALLQSVIELIVFYLYLRRDGSHVTLCAIYSTSVGCPYDLVLVALLLATWERYLALVRRQFHQHYATPRNISFLMFFVVLLLICGKTSPFWLGIFPIKCGLHKKLLSFAICFQGLLSLACLSLQVRLYFFVRSCIRYSPTTTGGSNKMEAGTQQHTIRIITSISPSSDDLQHRNSTLNQRVSRLEMRAARILGMGILPFCLVTLTLCVGVVVLFVCRLTGLDVHWISILMLTFRELLLVHLIYIPTVFIAQSSEFRSAVRRFCRHRHPKSTAQFE